MKIQILLLSLLFISGQLPAQQKDQGEKVKSWMTSYRFSQAIDLAETILATDSSRIDILILKGKSQFALFRYPSALETFGKALGKDSTDTRVLLEMSEVYRQLGETEKAIKTCHKITELEPDNPYFSLQLASLYLQNEDYKSALSVFQALYLNDTNDFYILKQMAGCLNELKSADSAMIYYWKALKLKPFDPGVTLKLTNILIKKRDFSSAISLTDHFLSMHSMHPGILKLSGYSRYMIKDYVGAVTRFARAIEAGDQSKFLYKYYGLSFYKQDKYDSAAPLFRNAFAADTTDAEVCFYFGVSHFRTFPVSDTGLIFLRRTLSLLMPSDQFLSTLYIELAAVYNMSGRTDTALILLKRAYEGSPQNNTLAFKIAYQYDYHLRNPKEALPYYQIFIRDMKKSEESVSNNPQQVSYSEYARNRIKEISR